MDTIITYERHLSPDKKDVNFFKYFISVRVLMIIFQIINYSRDEDREKMQSCNPQRINQKIRLSSPQLLDLAHRSSWDGTHGKSWCNYCIGLSSNSVSTGCVITMLLLTSTLADPFSCVSSVFFFLRFPQLDCLLDQIVTSDLEACLEGQGEFAHTLWFIILFAITP